MLTKYSFSHSRDPVRKTGPKYLYEEEEHFSVIRGRHGGTRFACSFGKCFMPDALPDAACLVSNLHPFIPESAALPNKPPGRAKYLQGASKVTSTQMTLNSSNIATLILMINIL